MLEIKNASLSLEGKQLFEGLSLRIDDGQVACLSGPPGCGKTLLLEAIMGLRPLDAGHISIDGELLSEASAEEMRQLMAYVPEGRVNLEGSVSDVVAHIMGLKANRSIKFSKERLMEEWGRLELSVSLLGSPLEALSEGERLRVMLAMAGIMEKPIVIADQPTTGLDPDAAKLAADYLARLAHQRGATIVAASNDELFQARCDKVCPLAVGPREDRAQATLGSSPGHVRNEPRPR